MTLARWLLLGGMVVVAAAHGLEARVSRAAPSRATRRQRILRRTAAVTLEAILLLLFFLPNIHSIKQPLSELAYLALIMGLGCALVFIALLDVRETIAAFQETRKEAYRELIEGTRKR